jgi:hypothetical protein
VSVLFPVLPLREVTEVTGETFKSPMMVVAPVLVTVEHPRTATLCAEPSVDVANPEAGLESSAANNALVKMFNFHIDPPYFFSRGVLLRCLVAYFS